MTTSNLLDYVPPSDMNTVTYRGSNNEEEKEIENVAQQAHLMNLNNVGFGNINPMFMYQNSFIPNQQALQNSFHPMLMPTMQTFQANQGNFPCEATIFFVSTTFFHKRQRVVLFLANPLKVALMKKLSFFFNST